MSPDRSRRERARQRREPQRRAASRGPRAPQARPAPHTPGPSGRGTGRGWRRARWILLVAAGAVAATVLYRALRPAVLHGIPAAPDPAAHMSASEAHKRAAALISQGREAESLPYFRRAAADARESSWQLHVDYAGALYNLTRRLRSRRGMPISMLPSSYEEVESMQQACGEMDVAERLAQDPRDLATVKFQRAQMMELWGFPWEAFVAYRQARDLNPAAKEIAVQGDRYMDLMRFPDRVPRK